MVKAQRIWSVNTVYNSNVYFHYGNLLKKCESVKNEQYDYLKHMYSKL